MTKKESWIKIEKHSDFPLYNIPFGIANIHYENKAVTRIGNTIIDLQILQNLGCFSEFNLPDNFFTCHFLNDFIALGKAKTRLIRHKIMELFSIDSTDFTLEMAFYKLDKVQMQMPIKVGDYTDFYSSREHATNVGTMFRDPANALLPNWLHLPVGYHGRASSIILSGVDIRRPYGQTKADDADKPSFGPSKLLDFELEMAFVTHQGKSLGERISIDEAEDYIFGMLIFNDWSARDIQKWEYVPLGPFLAKNFASSISPWIVTLDALEPFRTASPKQEPEVLPYLQQAGNNNFDIELEVYIKPEKSEAHKVCHSNFKHMYWSMAQQLAHHTVNGCNINAGDMCASGTISGPTPDSYGSMLELSWRGTKPIAMPDGSERKFINDYDSVIMKAYCKKDDLYLGFGEVETKVLPAV
jgi:fumarylacetoacetase